MIKRRQWQRKASNPSPYADAYNPEPSPQSSSSANLTKQLSKLAPFRYTPLAKNTIRLLRVSPGLEGSPIKCTLKHALFDLERKPPQYLALSYVWGSDTAAEAISLNGKLFKVTKNLYKALEELRKHHDDFTRFYLWIDALCIDQSNTTEKSHQVSRMAAIFSRAFYVISWLGPVDDSEDDCVESVFQRLNDVPESGHPVTPLIDHRDERVLRRIAERPWFFRVWTLQECTIPEDCRLHAGRHTISISAFTKGCLAFLNLPTNSAGYRSLHCIEEIRERIHSGESQEHSDRTFATDLLMYVQASSRRRCLIDHDILYGILGLLDAEWNTPDELRPNYNKSFERVCHDYASYAMHCSHGLRLLEMRRNDLEDSIPTWVPDFRHATNLGIIQPDTNEWVGLSPDSRQLYLAGCHIGVCSDSIKPKYVEPRGLAWFTQRINALEDMCFPSAHEWGGLAPENFLTMWLDKQLKDSCDPEVVACLCSWMRQRKRRPRDEVEERLNQQLGEALGPCIGCDILCIFLSSSFVLLDNGLVGRATRADAIIEPGDVVVLCRGAESALVLRPRWTPIMPWSQETIFTAKGRPENENMYKLISSLKLDITAWDPEANPSGQQTEEWYLKHELKPCILV